MFGEALYGPKRRPSDAVLTYARSRRNKRITPLPKVA